MQAPAKFRTPPPTDPVGQMRMHMNSCARSRPSRRCTSDRHCADFFFYFHRVNHGDGVPRAAIEEAAVGAFAQALLAADAENGIDRDAAERRIVFVRHPEHAVFYRTIFHAGGRAGTSGATLCDDGQLFRFLLARCGQALGFRFPFHLVGNHADSFDGAGCRRHARHYNPNSLFFSAYSGRF